MAMSLRKMLPLGRKTAHDQTLQLVMTFRPTVFEPSVFLEARFLDAVSKCCQHFLKRGWRHAVEYPK